MITEWVKEKARTPVLVKLTPNVTDIRTWRARPNAAGPTGSRQSTLSTPSLESISTRFVPRPNVDGKSSHGGYCGPAVKPIALNMVQQIMADPESALPLSGMGGISTWQRRSGVHSAGLRNGAGVHRRNALWLSHRRGHGRRARKLDATKGFATMEDFRGLSVARVTEWKHLNLNYKIVAHIDEQKCIGCDLCHIACWDGAHQCIHVDRAEGPVNGRVELHPTPAAIEERSRTSIAITPVTRKERAAAASESRAVSRRRWRKFHGSMRRSALDAISARWCVRLTSASR